MKFFIDNNYLEFTISLFTRCNLRCSFCAQEHNTSLDKHEILGIPDKVFSTFMAERVNRPNISEVGIRIWGGELFSDDIPDWYFTEYNKLRKGIEDRFARYPDIKLKFLYTTNAVFKNINRVVLFLSKDDSLAISYDPTLRYTAPYMDSLVRQNIAALHDKLGIPITVGIVLTKPTLEYYLSNFEEFISLAQAPSIDSIVFNYYIPNKGWEEHTPDDELLASFLVECLVNRVPKISNLELLKECFKNNECVGKECECAFLPNIFNNTVTKNCVECFSNLPQEDFYGDFLGQLRDVSGSKTENISETKALLGTEKRGCWTCTYADICPGMCWSSIIFKGYKPTKCPLAMCFKYLECN